MVAVAGGCTRFEPPISPAAMIREHWLIISCMGGIISCIEGAELGVGDAAGSLKGALDTLADRTSAGWARALPPSGALAHGAEPTKPAPARKTTATPRTAWPPPPLGKPSPFLQLDHEAVVSHGPNLQAFVYYYIS